MERLRRALHEGISIGGGKAGHRGRAVGERSGRRLNVPDNTITNWVGHIGRASLRGWQEPAATERQ